MYFCPKISFLLKWVFKMVPIPVFQGFLYFAQAYDVIINIFFRVGCKKFYSAHFDTKMGFQNSVYVGEKSILNICVGFSMRRWYDPIILKVTDSSLIIPLLNETKIIKFH